MSIDSQDNESIVKKRALREIYIGLAITLFAYIVLILLKMVNPLHT